MRSRLRSGGINAKLRSREVVDWDSHRGDKCQSDVFFSGGELQVQPTGRVHARESRCADDGESKLFELIGGCKQIEAGPLGLLGSSSSHHRRTLELVLQKSPASFRIT